MNTGRENKADLSKTVARFFANEKENLVRFVRRLIENTAERDGEDLVQDVMLGLFERADVTVPIENRASDGYRSLDNRIVDGYRRRKRFASLDSPALQAENSTLLDSIADTKYDVSGELEKRETIERVYEAIDRLSPRLKSVLIATELEGRTFRELSVEWKVPLGTLLSYKHRAVRTVRAMLAGEKGGRRNVLDQITSKEKHNEQ